MVQACEYHGDACMDACGASFGGVHCHVNSICIAAMSWAVGVMVGVWIMGPTDPPM